MRVIGVLDLAGGVAVHAVAGHRETYQPVRSRLVPGVGDAVALARAYRDVVGVRDIYLADLDAIVHGAPQRALVREVARAAAPAALMMDAGVSAPAGARLAIADGATRVVVGLETLRSFALLAAVVRDVGSERVTLGLDLRDGVPVVSEGVTRLADPTAIAEHVTGLGVTSILVVDVARVGTGRGVDLELVRRLRRACPSVSLLAGGGIRDRADLERLADAGADGALVATALHDGRVARGDVEALGAGSHDG